MNFKKKSVFFKNNDRNFQLSIKILNVLYNDNDSNYKKSNNEKNQENIKLVRVGIKRFSYSVDKNNKNIENIEETYYTNPIQCSLNNKANDFNDNEFKL